MSFINIRKIPREVLKTSGFALGFQHLPQDLGNVNEWKIMFDPYIVIEEELPATYMYLQGKAKETDIIISSLHSSKRIAKGYIVFLVLEQDLQIL